MIQILKRLWNAPRTFVRRFRVLDEVLAGRQQLSSDAVVHLDARISAIQARSEAVAKEVEGLHRDLGEEISAQLSFTYHDLARSVTELNSLFDPIVQAEKTNEELRAAIYNMIHKLEGRLGAQYSEGMSRSSELSAHVNDIRVLTAKYLTIMENQHVEFRNALGKIGADTKTSLDALGNKQFELGNLLTHVGTSTEARLVSLENRQFESQNHITHLNTSLHSRLDGTETRLSALENQQFESKNLIIHLNTSLHSRLDSSETRMSVLENQQYESKNLIIHLDTSLHSRLDTFENQLIPGVNDQIHEVIAAGLDLRALAERGDSPHGESSGTAYRPAELHSFEEYLNRAEKDFPESYKYWRERLDTMLHAFLKTKVGNAAHAGDTYSQIFRSIVRIYAKGRLLDVGCGIFGLPYYLGGYPEALVSGIEPLEPIETPSFELVRGISEYLPWPDSSFSTVISATSLDHCLSLERSLSEVVRVLEPDGHFLLWIGSNPGAAAYDPTSENFVPADEFHLFHFDVTWFEPMLDKWFDVVERVYLRKTSFSHLIYCLKKKPAASVNAARRSGT